MPLKNSMHRIPPLSLISFRVSLVVLSFAFITSLLITEREILCGIIMLGVCERGSNRIENDVAGNLLHIIVRGGRRKHLF